MQQGLVKAEGVRVYLVPLVEEHGALARIVKVLGAVLMELVLLKGRVDHR